MGSTKRFADYYILILQKKDLHITTKKLIFSEQYTNFQYKHASILVVKEATESIASIILK
jgi:hypothetical protein